MPDTDREAGAVGKQTLPNIDTVIPIVVGVTGHRDLREEDIPKLKEIVTDILQKIQKQCPNSPVWMLNSLAAGADQLCAQVANSLQIPIYCPLPMPKDAYCTDFNEEEQAAFDAIKTAEMFVAPHVEPEQEDRNYCYRQAGIYVATHCHVLLALWDGEEEKSNDGCGTAAAVTFMRTHNYRDGNLFYAANESCVIQVKTPRVTKNQAFAVTVKMEENEQENLKDLLKKTEQFNRDLKKNPPIHMETDPDTDTKSLQEDADHFFPKVPDASLNQGKIGRMRWIYKAANKLSLCNQDRYKNTMGLIAVFSVLLVLLYLLYDEATLNLCLVFYGAVILLYAIFYFFAGYNKIHEKYLQYRTLAETLRVQIYLYALGSGDCVCDDFTWNQKWDATWVKKAVCALLIGKQEEKLASDVVVKQSWIDGQLEYHQGAGKRDAGDNRKQERITRAMLACIVVMWLVVLILEYRYPEWMSAAFFGLTVQSWFKILWGCVSVVTIFVSGYYGKRSLQRKSIDHAKMASLFANAKSLYESGGIDKMELFRQLAREEIIENGEWVSYCKENTLDFNL